MEIHIKISCIQSRNLMSIDDGRAFGGGLLNCQLDVWNSQKRIFFIHTLSQILIDRHRQGVRG